MSDTGPRGEERWLTPMVHLRARNLRSPQKSPMSYSFFPTSSSRWQRRRRASQEGGTTSAFLDTFTLSAYRRRRARSTHEFTFDNVQLLQTDNRGCFTWLLNVRSGRGRTWRIRGRKIADKTAGKAREREALANSPRANSASEQLPGKHNLRERLP